MRKEILDCEPFVWTGTSSGSGYYGFLFLTTDSIALLVSSKSGKLEENREDGFLKSVAKDVMNSLGGGGEWAHEVSHSIGDYTIEDFEEDMKISGNLEIKFDLINELRIMPYSSYERLWVMYNDGKEDHERYFVKAEKIHEEYGSPSGITPGPFNWELTKNIILAIKDMK